MSAYPEHKPCEGDWIKEIPAGWKVVRGKYLFEIKKRIVGEVGHDVLSITQKGIKVKDTESGDGQLSMDYSKYQIVEPGDFAMNHMDLLTGYVDISKFNGVTSPDYRVFTVKEAASSPRYFLYFFQMGYSNKIFFKYGQGASHLGRWRLPTEEFNNFWFPCPPKEDRENIADFLDYEIGRIDTLVEKQQQLIKLLKEKRQAVISHAVTKGLNPNAPMRDSGVEWLGEVPEHWERIKLKHITKEIIDAEHKTAEYFDDGEFLVCRTTNVRDGQLRLEGGKYTNLETYTEWSRRGVPEAGDILFTREAPAGEACVYLGNIPLCLGQRMVLFKLKTERVEPHFVLHSIYSGLSDDFVKQLSQGSTVAHFNMADIQNIPLFEPPIDEQIAINEYLGKVLSEYDGLIRSAEDAINLMQERRAALISAAVTGKIDVRNWQVPEPSAHQNKEVAA